MGLLDSIISEVTGGGGRNNTNANSGGLGSILGSLLASQGGVGGLVQKMQQAGMGDAVNSWVGNGQNQPVDQHQLGNAIGHDQVNQWSQQTGMSHNTILSELSKMLPNAVDKMTPNGRVEDTSSSTDGSSPFDQPGLEMPRS